MAKKVSIYDIADRLKISPSTVSRALSRSSLVNVQTKMLVSKTAEEMGYIDHKTPSNANTIAIIVPEFNNYFYSEVISSIQNSIKNKYLLSIYCSFNSFKIEKEIVSKMNPDHIRCLIISQSMDSEDSSHIKDIEKKGIPIILFNRVNYNFNSPKFLIDNYRDSYLLTEHLLSSGYNKIAFAAKHFNCQIYKERVQAYKDVLIENNIGFNPDYLLYSELTLDDTHDVISRFINLKSRPDALILPTFISALQAISIAKINNISTPEEMAIVSFDGDPECRYSSPSITGIERPCTEIGSKIGQLSLEICDNKIYDKNTTKIFHSNLIIRGSSLSIF
ncbi:MAG: LacI family DNA-binding transcriptional regulator [Fermentimonas sp.]|nr:LacI family DNA-binding transcriptional regulator [Fermentimonas sp.]